MIKRIRGMTTGRVVGLDPAEGMIEKTKAACQEEDIEFMTGRADRMSYDAAF
ncbi:MAG: class I SAM-dependent methyltransferase [Nitrospinota bacterium]|nr:class I SAM-dependent methyltransferase [Nitrospinota bacterium]